MRILAILLVSALFTAACSREAALSTAPPQVAQTIDLDTPGAVDVLRVRYPTHHLALSDLLRNSHLLHCEENKVHARVQAREVLVEISPTDCGGFLLTSFPPKAWARLEFRIDDTRYSKTVYLTMY